MIAATGFLVLSVARCSEDAGTGPGNPTAELEVTISTTGDDIDPDGYTVALDGQQTVDIPANGSGTFTNVPAGSHTVEVTGVAANCQVQGSNPRTVVIQANTTNRAQLSVVCAGLVGSLRVEVSTIGDDLDPDGYTVTVTQAAAPAAGAAPPGASGLSETAGAGGAEAAVGDEADGVGRRLVRRLARLAKKVAGAAGTLVASRSPAAPATVTQSVAPNGSVTFTALPDGQHTVALGGVAANCAVGGTQPAPVEILPDETVVLGLTVTCAALMGSLQVTASTSGSDQDADGYTVTVDGTLSRTVGVNASTTFTGLDDGPHSVQLSGIAPNCTVGSNPRTVNVPAGGTGSTTFNVTCSARVGDLLVEVTTGGTDLDPNGYTVTVDGSLSAGIGINSSLLFEDLAEGDHAVQLSGVANNCTVTTANPLTASVPNDGTASVSFAVSCSDAVGNLDVTVNATGTDVDPEYTVTVDGTLSQTVAANTTVTFAGLAAGIHNVQLSGIAGNCSVTGSTLIQVNVPNGGMAARTFDVTCTDRLGQLAVTASTSGNDLDPNGYTAVVDGSQSLNVAINATMVFNDLAEGDHTVQLTGVAGNCTVSGENPRTVTVPFNAMASTTFSVSCTTRRGDVNVSVSTTGADLDPDGYSVTVDPGTGQASTQSVAINGAVTFTGLTEGDHSFLLSGLAGNCTVDGMNPVDVTVPFNGTANASFAVTCVDRVGSLQVTTATTGTDFPSGYTVVVDGGSGRPIGTAATITIANLAEGNHTVQLTNVAANCTVAAPNPRDVTVPFDGTASTTFAIDCVTFVGNLEIAVTTTGDSLDPNGYTVTLDGGQSQPVAINGTVTFGGVEDGDHSVQLGDLRENCTVTGNPATVNVPPDGTGSHTFSVTCDRYEGALEVVIATTGQNQDPNGYTVTVNGQSQAVGVNGSVVFPDLPVGTYAISVTGRQDNCNLSAGSPTSAQVTYNNQVSAPITVECQAFEQVLVGAGSIADSVQCAVSPATSSAESTAVILDQTVAATPGAAVFTAGDHVHPRAHAAGFSGCYDPTWGRHYDRTRPALGNREYVQVDPQATPYFDYWGDRAGPRGDGYYAFNLGSWRVIVLNSEDPDGVQDGSPQLQWLATELSESAKLCSIAIWHTPRWSSGEVKRSDGKYHDFWETLYDGGVELVINGGARFYERFDLQGRDSIPTPDPFNGMRQITVGTGGAGLGNVDPNGIAPNSLVRITANHGVLRLALHQSTYDWEFLPVPAGSAALDSGSGSCR